MMNILSSVSLQYEFLRTGTMLSLYIIVQFYKRLVPAQTMFSPLELQIAYLCVIHLKKKKVQVVSGGLWQNLAPACLTDPGLMYDHCLRGQKTKK